jgi:hypothetical protein
MAPIKKYCGFFIFLHQRQHFADSYGGKSGFLQTILTGNKFLMETGDGAIK